MIPVEVREPNLGVIFRAMSSKVLREEVDLANDVRKMVYILEKALKQRIARRYNSIVVS